jgi:DNA-directed RNA polymerase specialized sigma24 family protein
MTTSVTSPQATSAGVLWPLAYAITGDRAAAAAIVEDVLARAAGGGLSPARVRREDVARARVRAARQHDRLWSALRPLPRRRRAEIVQRLAGSLAGPRATHQPG